MATGVEGLWTCKGSGEGVPLGMPSAKGKPRRDCIYLECVLVERRIVHIQSVWVERRNCVYKLVIHLPLEI